MCAHSQISHTRHIPSQRFADTGDHRSIGILGPRRNTTPLTCGCGHATAWAPHQRRRYRSAAAGIDAPEFAGKCAKEKALALVTRDFLRGQLAGASVLQQQVFRDKFFRIEATVIANGVNIKSTHGQEGLRSVV